MLTDDTAKCLEIFSANHLSHAAILEELVTTLASHGTAFNEGMISLPRLLAVVAFPWLKITAKVDKSEARAARGQHQLSAAEAQVKEIRDTLAKAWFDGFERILGGKMVKDNRRLQQMYPFGLPPSQLSPLSGVDPSLCPPVFHIPLLSPAKRSEVISALLQADFLEV